jgi:SAM-dependent methyltransferase
MTEQRWTREKILETSGSFWLTCTLHAGVELDIFSLMGDGRMTAEEVARKLDGDPRGVTMLLNALTAMGLLVKQDGSYANSLESKSFLVKSSDQYSGYIIRHHHNLVSAWARLPEAVTSGKPVRQRSSYGGERERENFLMGMFNNAMAIAPQLAKEIDLSGRRHLLDLGGGPGTYAIHFCLENPQLKGTVYDLPATEPFARKTFERFGVADRVDFFGGDYLQDEIPGSYDVVWLSHILHSEGPGTCQEIINDAVAVLEPGGLILIQDFILSDSLDGPLFPALFALNMLVNTPRGRSYSEGKIREFLARAGVREVIRLPFCGPSDAGIISGMK